MGAPPMKFDRQFIARASLAFAHDVVAAGVAWLAAFWLRFELELPPPEFRQVAFATLPAVLAVHALAFWILGLYRGLWRYASLPDLQRILVAVAVAALAVPALFTLVGLQTPVPRSVYLIMPVLLIGAMCGSRLLYRAWKERTLLGMVRHPGAAPVLVLGAGTAAASLLRDLANSDQWRAVGLLDDDTGKRGSAIQGVKILGALGEVGTIAQGLGVAQAVIAMPSATHGQRRRAVELCSAAGLQVMTVPSYADLVSGKVSVSALRNVELDDLLGRDPVTLDDAGLRGLIEGQCVLVTGAGGSIGAELCRQIARYAPSRLVLFDLSEYALYAVEQEFRDRLPGVPIAALIGDAKSAPRVREVFGRFQPQVVFHAAAYKHVPLMEGENAFQAVANNVLSTVVVARAAQAAGAGKVRAGVHRQGGQPDQRDGRLQAPRRDRLPGAAGGGRHAVRHGALRQRARLHRQRDPALSRADRARRAGDRDASGDPALLHVHPRGHAARAAGGADGQGRGDLRARHGRAGEDRRPRAPADPALRL